MTPARRVPRFVAPPVPGPSAADLAFVCNTWAELRAVPADAVTVEARPPFGFMLRAPGFVRPSPSLRDLLEACAELAARKIRGDSVEGDRSPERIDALNRCLSACVARLGADGAPDQAAPRGAKEVP